MSSGQHWEICPIFTASELAEEMTAGPEIQKAEDDPPPPLLIQARTYLWRKRALWAEADWIHRRQTPQFKHRLKSTFWSSDSARYADHSTYKCLFRISDAYFTEKYRWESWEHRDSLVTFLLAATSTLWGTEIVPSPPPHHPHMHFLTHYQRQNHTVLPALVNLPLAERKLSAPTKNFRQVEDDAFLCFQRWQPMKKSCTEAFWMRL